MNETYIIYSTLSRTYTSSSVSLAYNSRMGNEAGDNTVVKGTELKQNYKTNQKGTPKVVFF